MKWHCLQHVPFEGPAYLAMWAQDRGHTLERTELWTGSRLPALEEFDGLFILGGPMNVYEEDRHPWLAPEKAFIARAITAQKPILGICLGAQLLSTALGGIVARSPRREIGWFPVELTREAEEAALLHKLPDQFMAFHWHGDRFTIPPGAIHVARSEACDEQAFVYGDRIVGLQFHLESTQESIAALIRHCGGEISCAPYVQDPPSIEEYTDRLPETHALLDRLLDDLVAGWCGAELV